MTLTLWQWIGLALLVTIGGETFWIHHQASELSTYKASVETYKSAQETNLSTIAKLQDANGQWASDSERQIENGQAYTKAAVEYALQQQAKAKKSNAQLQAVYVRFPEAKAWASVTVNPAVSEQLRANSGPH